MARKLLMYVIQTRTGSRGRQWSNEALLAGLNQFDTRAAAEAFMAGMPEPGPRTKRRVSSFVVLSYKAQMQVHGEADTWHDNGIRLATRKEADDYGFSKFCAWTMCIAHRAVASPDPVNYSYATGSLVAIQNEVTA